MMTGKGGTFGKEETASARLPLDCSFPIVPYTEQAFERLAQQTPTESPAGNTMALTDGERGFPASQKAPTTPTASRAGVESRDRRAAPGLKPPTSTFLAAEAAWAAVATASAHSSGSVR